MERKTKDSLEEKDCFRGYHVPYPEDMKWLLESEIAGLLISSKIYRGREGIGN